MKGRVSALSLALLCLCCLILPARADMGPKPDLTITVVSAPEGACYVDLLYEGGEETLYTDLSTVDYDPELLSALHSLEGDGWVLACTTGTSGPPIFGDLLPNDAGQYVYSYFGLPQTFRLAVATQDGAQATEESYTRVRFHTNLVYDWSTNTLSERTSTPVYYLTQLASTLLPTLVLEGVVLLLFGFRQRRTWLVFLLVNLITQVGLHLFCNGQVLAAAQGNFSYYLLLMAVPELVIFAVEAVAYQALLQEHTHRRRVGYTLCANLASFLIGFLPLHLLSSLLIGL